MKHFVTLALFGALLASGSAHAVQITGSSTGSFSAPTGCSGNDVCGRTNTGSGATAVTNGQLYWGSTSNNSIQNPSTLTGGYTTINAATPTNDTVIGSLTWFNSSTNSNRTPDTLGSTYTLTVMFTSPAGSSGDAQAFTITIDNTSNPTGDNIVNGLTLSNLSGLSFNLPGVTVSDLHYSCAAGCGAGRSTFSASNNASNWYNAENNTATLQIVGDFHATAVPEPASLAVLGAGLVGLGLVRRRTASVG